MRISRTSTIAAIMLMQANVQAMKHERQHIGHVEAATITKVLSSTKIKPAHIGREGRLWEFKQVTCDSDLNIGSYLPVDSCLLESNDSTTTEILGANAKDIIAALRSSKVAPTHIGREGQGWDLRNFECSFDLSLGDEEPANRCSFEVADAQRKVLEEPTFVAVEGQGCAKGELAAAYGAYFDAGNKCAAQGGSIGALIFGYTTYNSKCSDGDDGYAAKATFKCLLSDDAT